MEFVFDNFKQSIDSLITSGHLTDSVRLILLGRVAFAVERADLTLIQARELHQLIGPEFAALHQKDSQLAAFGDTLDALGAKAA